MWPLFDESAADSYCSQSTVVIIVSLHLFLNDNHTGIQYFTQSSNDNHVTR